jgi:hypothetical protein
LFERLCRNALAAIGACRRAATVANPSGSDPGMPANVDPNCFRSRERTPHACEKELPGGDPGFVRRTQLLNGRSEMI